MTKGFIFVLALLTAIPASAESAFNYSGVSAGIGFVTLGIEDSDQELNARSLGVSLSNELSNQFVAGLGVNHLVVDDILYDDGIYFDTTGTQTTFNITFGRYFVVNPLFDITVSGTIGFSKYESDTLLTDINGNSLYVEDSGTDSSVGGRIGARMLLSEAGNFEVSPSLTYITNEGESDTVLGAEFALNLTPKANIGLSFNTSTKEDQTSFGVFGKLYF
ncbi:outer membrane beta-barrel protein [Thalassolituus maritimus]|uniref:Outer membrane protein beta-barrel domain-containing protein n=1 Tax=Thalassolituus maritimus TaxID=484498 RepID=A0ABQ0A0B0_9GAMM